MTNPLKIDFLRSVNEAYTHAHRTTHSTNTNTRRLGQQQPRLLVEFGKRILKRKDILFVMMLSLIGAGTRIQMDISPLGPSPSFRAEQPTALPLSEQRPRPREQEQSQRRLCTAEETRHGAWVPVTLDKPPYIPRASKCYSAEELQNATSWPYHHWHPYGKTDGLCRFDQWDAAAFCALAHNKTVGIMGDSLSWEHFASLAGLLGVLVGPHDQLKSNFSDGTPYAQDIPMTHPVCNGTARVGFYRNRYLLYPKWFLDEVDPDIMVFNTGAHGQSEHELVNGYAYKPGESGMLALIDNLRRYQEERCRPQGRRCLVLWRTTAPGHPGCANFSAPATNVTKMEEWIRYDPARYPGKASSYNWWAFAAQDQVITDLFDEALRNASAPRFAFDVLRAYDVNVLRPDAHVGAKDCLHNCDPGAVDVYSTLLLHLMRLHFQNPQN